MDTGIRPESITFSGGPGAVSFGEVNAYLRNPGTTTETRIPMASTTDPMETVRQYIDCFNRSDVNGMAAACNVPMTILDGMAPHVWHGPTATQDWYRDVQVEGEHAGASGYLITLGEPWHVNVTGDRGYVVVPATMTFRLQGTPVTQTGSTFTAALRKLDAGWRVMAWAWAKGSQ